MLVLAKAIFPDSKVPVWLISWLQSFLHPCQWWERSESGKSSSWHRSRDSIWLRGNAFNCFRSDWPCVKLLFPNLKFRHHWLPIIGFATEHICAILFHPAPFIPQPNRIRNILFSPIKWEEEAKQRPGAPGQPPGSRWVSCTQFSPALASRRIIFLVRQELFTLTLCWANLGPL